MNIYTVNNDYNISMQGKGKSPNWLKKQLKRVEQKFLDMMPCSTSKESKNSTKNWDKSSHWVGDPMWNRGIMGATALLTQPAIDYYNHRVDNETRTVSRNRTAAKIIAGTTVGMFVVRGPVYKMVEKMTDLTGKGKWAKKLLPKTYIEELTKNPNALKNYRSSIAMALILGVNCITNFVLDAPFTMFLTNYFNKKSGVETSDKNKDFINSEKEKTEVDNG